MRYTVLMVIFISMITAVSVQAGPSAMPGVIITSGEWGTLWAYTPTSKVMRNTPQPSNTVKSVRIYAAANEYEPFQIVLTPKKALANVKVIPHTLTGPKGAKIEAWNISAKNVEYVNVTDPTSNDVSAGLYPDPLPNHTPFTADTGINSPVWITVYIPPKAAPGEYKGNVDVTANGLGKVVVPVSLHVWNFALPSVSRLRTAYGRGMNEPADYQGAATI